MALERLALLEMDLSTLHPRVIREEIILSAVDQDLETMKRDSRLVVCTTPAPVEEEMTDLDDGQEAYPVDPG